MSLCLLILHDTISADARADELDTLIQVAQISKVMQTLGWQVNALATGLDLDTTAEQIRALQPDCIVNLVESLAGEGKMIHFIPSLLSVINIPYTGVDADAMYLTSHKRLAKKIMQLNNISTAESFSLGEIAPLIAAQWIVKSVWEHASFGLDDNCVVNNSAAAMARIQDCQQQFGGEWFAERYLEGREFNVSVLEINGQPHILPIAEIHFIDYPHNKPKIVSYDAKWDESTFDYQATQRVFPTLPAPLSNEIHELVLNCWQAFNLKSYARVDIRCDANNKAWVLEVNANPCLAKDAGFAAAALQSGLSYSQLISNLVESAMSGASQESRHLQAPPHNQAIRSNH